MGIPAKQLKVNGKPMDVRAIGWIAEVLQKLLDQAATDELFTPSDLGRKLKRDPRVIALQQGKLPGYHALVGGRRYWGSRQAIAELKRQLAAGA